MFHFFILPFVLFVSSIDSSELNDKSIFLAGLDDPYTFADFSEENELEELIELDNNKEFSVIFQNTFQDDFDIYLQYEKINNTNVDTWEMSLFSKRNQQVEFLKNHPLYPNLSSKFIALIHANIKYNYWHLLLAYSINRSNQNTGLSQVTSLPGVMTDALKNANVSHSDHLLSKSYRSFLPLYVTYFNSQEKKFQKYADIVLAISDKATFASKHLKQDVLDYTLSLLLKQYHPLLTTTSFRYWNSQINDQSLQSYLSDNLYEIVINAELSRNELVVNKKKDKSKLPAILDLSDKSFTFGKYKGKVIYVDFWASWCGPCRKEFPFSKKMHEGLTNGQRKDLIFLYVSIDENLDKWRSAVQSLGLHEFGENGHSYEVANKYQISSIPRYMIIDQKGIIREPNASRPSNPETLQTLLRLLK